MRKLASESVESTALPLEGVDDIHGSYSLPLGVLSVGDGIPDDILKEYLENTSGLFVDEARDTLDTTTTSKATNSRLGDTLDIVTKNLAMTLGATLSESLASLTTSSHFGDMCMLHKSDETRPVPEPFYSSRFGWRATVLYRLVDK